MKEKNKKLENIGITISSLGGLLVILNSKDSDWGLIIAIAAVVLALFGVYLISKAQSSPKMED